MHVYALLLLMTTALIALKDFTILLGNEVAY